MIKNINIGELSTADFLLVGENPPLAPPRRGLENPFLGRDELAIFK